MCDCRHCGRWEPCDLGSSCPNDECGSCVEERDEAQRDEAADRRRDELEAEAAAQFFDRR
jgi:hypothetical protein